MVETQWKLLFLFQILPLLFLGFAQIMKTEIIFKWQYSCNSCTQLCILTDMFSNQNCFKIRFFSITSQANFGKFSQVRPFFGKFPFVTAKYYLPQDPTPFNLLFSMLINYFVHFLFSSAYQSASKQSHVDLKITAPINNWFRLLVGYDCAT